MPDRSHSSLVCGFATSIVAVLVAAGLPVALASPTFASAPPAAAAAPDDPDPVHYKDESVAGSTRTVTGDLVAVAVDKPGQSVQYTIETKQGETVVLDLGKQLPADVVQGTITAQLTRAGDVRSATIQPAAVEAAVPAEHRAYVVKVTNRGDYFNDDGTPATDADIAAIIDLGMHRWVAESNGYIPSFERVGEFKTGEAAGSVCQSGSALYHQFDNELFPDVDFGAGTGNHLIVVQPRGCGSGIGTVGSSINSGGKLTFDFHPNKNTTTIPHELGHNLSLNHSYTSYCDSTETPPCVEDEYGNTYTAMGESQQASGSTPWIPGSFDSFERSRLEITSPCEVPALALVDGQRSVTATYDLFGRATDIGTRGIKVVNPVDDQTYYLDWRNGLGRDSGSRYANRQSESARHKFTTGITVQRASTVDGDAVALLLGHLRADGGSDFGLASGGSYTTPGMTMHVDAIDPDAALDAASQVTLTLTDPDVTNPPALPDQSGSVAISGQPRLGSTVAAAPTDWTSGACFRYQWYADGVAIPGARQRTFTVPNDYLGRLLSVQVIGQTTGFVPRTQASPASPVTKAVFSQVAKPALRGTARVNNTLSITRGTWEPTPTAWAYQWLLNGAKISGATNATLKLAPAWAGKRISVQVTGARENYEPVTVASSAAAIARAAFVAPAPKIIGTATVGRTLKLSRGTWRPSPSKWAYQWLANGRNIAGVTGRRTYLKLTRTLKGKRISVKVSGSRPGYVTKSRISARTKAVR